MKAASLLAAISLVAPCYSAVIQNVVTILPPNTATAPYNFPYRAFTSVSPYAGSIRLEISNTATNEFTFQARTFGEAWSLLLVEQGLDFDAAYVSSHPHFADNHATQTGVFTLAAGQTAYIAFWDQVGPPLNFLPKDTDQFGWALVRNVGGNLVVVDSAAADSGGIKVGTLQQIPEAGIPLSFAVGAACFFLRRRRLG